MEDQILITYLEKEREFCKGFVIRMIKKIQNRLLVLNGGWLVKTKKEEAN